jgi:hypothetical protein
LLPDVRRVQVHVSIVATEVMLGQLAGSHRPSCTGAPQSGDVNATFTPAVILRLRALDRARFRDERAEMIRFLNISVAVVGCASITVIVLSLL